MEKYKEISRKIVSIGDIKSLFDAIREFLQIRTGSVQEQLCCHRDI